MKKRGHRSMLVGIFALAGLAAISFLCISFFINNTLNQVNYDKGIEKAGIITGIEPIPTTEENEDLDAAYSPQPDTVYSLQEDPDAAYSPQEDPDAAYSPQSEIVTLEQQIRENIASNAQPLDYENNVLNILLIGVDTGTSGNCGRSDTMILLSINRENKTIVITSFMRDIYLAIPGMNSANRLNAATVFGGSGLLLKTLEQNFKISVDKYVMVDFLSFVDIFDCIGGVSVNISDDEVEVANGYIKGINWLKELPILDGLIESAGEQNLTGKQILGYSRIRYVGNGDFDRTARQRFVLNQAFVKLKTMDVIKLYHLLNTLLSKLTTNMSKNELFFLISSLPEISNYMIDSWSIPDSGTYKDMNIRGMAVLGIDFAANTKALQKRIYGDNDESLR